MITENVRLLLNKLDTFCLGQLDGAAGLAMGWGHYEIGVEHLVAKFLDLDRCEFQVILQEFEVDISVLHRELEKSLEGFRKGNTGRPVFSPQLLEWVEQAWTMASVEFAHDRIRSGHLLATLCTPFGRRTFSWIGRGLGGVSREAVSAVLTAGVESIEAVESLETESKGPAPEGLAALEQFTINVTEKARAGEIDPVFARDDEIRQMMDILTRRRKNNPILVGEPGTGKTAIVEGFALRVTQGEVPPMFEGVEIFTLDLALLQAGASVKGEFENRLRTVIEAIKSYPGPVVTFIDEAHTLIGAGGAAGMGDAANLLKPALARGELRTIAATTWTEYKKYFEKDPALARRFQLVKVAEPEDEGAIAILRGLKKIYETHHGVRISDGGVVAAVQLSRRYITGRLLPDKAIDLLDTAAARVVLSQNALPPVIAVLEQKMATLDREKRALEGDASARGTEDLFRERLERIQNLMTACDQEAEELRKRWAQEKELVAHYLESCEEMGRLPETASHDHRQEMAEQMVRIAGELQAFQAKEPLVFPEVDEQVIDGVIADWTGIPIGRMTDDEAEKLMRLESHLTRRVMGQNHAISRIIDTLRVAKTGLKSPEQPMGVFFLMGPSGVGKTETGLGLAEEIFGGEQYVVTINMSEYQEKHNVSKLIGSPPGYVGYGEGGVLTEAVRQKPYTVVLLDEVEKAHPDVMDIFYQVFDKGTLADGEGRIVNFRNTVILVTSNLASSEIMELTAQADPKDIPSMEAILSAVRPALLSHFKPALLARMTLLPYYPLGRDIISAIVKKKLDKVAHRLAQRSCILGYDNALVEWVVSRCDLADNGARNVESVINLQLLPKISMELLSRMGNHDTMEEVNLHLEVVGGDILFRFAGSVDA